MPKTGLAALLGDRPVAGLAPEDYAAVMDRWTEVAPATWNRHLSALVSSPPGLSARTSWPPAPPAA
ncbi:hypothetical protein [Nonomuraea sp. KM90]|uniref:hypothetical protein n=1 Tax=Nonomuraea sp. KM90 TaxID=3457428 RepID=UPI003FCD596C